MKNGNSSNIRRGRYRSTCLSTCALAAALCVIGNVHYANAGTLANGGTFTVTSWDNTTFLGEGTYYDADGGQTYAGVILPDVPTTWAIMDSAVGLIQSGRDALAAAWGFVDMGLSSGAFSAAKTGLQTCQNYNMWGSQYDKDNNRATRLVAVYPCLGQTHKEAWGYDYIVLSESSSALGLGGGAGCTTVLLDTMTSKKIGDLATYIYHVGTIYEQKVTCTFQYTDAEGAISDFGNSLLAGDASALQVFSDTLATMDPLFWEDGSGGYDQSLFSGPAVQGVDVDTPSSVTNPVVSGGNIATGTVNTTTVNNGDGTETTTGEIELRFPETLGVEISNLDELAAAMAVPEEELPPELEIFTSEAGPSITEDVINLGLLSTGSGWLPASCPAPLSADLMGSTVDFSFQPACDMLTMLKPFVIALSFLSGLYVVFGMSGGRRAA